MSAATILEANPCISVTGAFSSTECADLIRRAEQQGFFPTRDRYPSGYRDNDRIVLDDPTLSASTYERICARLKPRTDSSGRVWKPIGCNERFRFCRYAHGQSFTMHRDGAHTRQNGERSWMTCQLYLNSQDQFLGGTTRFFSDRFAGQPLHEVVPACGLAILFDHTRWHDGAPVFRGTKYVMRTDIMYAPEYPNVNVQPGHDGYVWAVAALDDQTMLSSGRDGFLRLWTSSVTHGWKATGMWALSGRDGQSITAIAVSGDAIFAGTREGALLRFDRLQVLGAAASGTSFPDPTCVLDTGPAVLSLTLAADGSLILGAANGTLHCINDRGHVIKHGHDGFIWSVAAVGKKVAATVGDDGYVVLWDLETMRELSRVWIKSSVRSLCVSNNHLVIGDGEGHIHRAIFEGATLRVEASLAHVHEGPVTCLVAIEGGYVSTGEDGKAVLSGTSHRCLHRHSDFASCICRIGDHIVTGGYDGHLLSAFHIVI